MSAPAYVSVASTAILCVNVCACFSFPGQMWILQWQTPPHFPLKLYQCPLNLGLEITLNKYLSAAHMNDRKNECPYRSTSNF